jgi:hypothetical protein
MQRAEACIGAAPAALPTRSSVNVPPTVVYARTTIYANNMRAIG